MPDRGSVVAAKQVLAMLNVFDMISGARTCFNECSCGLYAFDMYAKAQFKQAGMNAIHYAYFNCISIHMPANACKFNRNIFHTYT